MSLAVLVKGALGDDTIFGPIETRSPRIRITAWRLFNTVVILSLGMTKAFYTYMGYVSTPTTLDWIIGVTWAIISYWVGLLESESPSIAPWLFEEDLYRNGVLDVLVGSAFLTTLFVTMVTVVLEGARLLVEMFLRHLTFGPMLVVMVLLMNCISTCFVIFVWLFARLLRVFAWSHASVAPFFSWSDWGRIPRLVYAIAVSFLLIRLTLSFIRVTSSQVVDQILTPFSYLLASSLSLFVIIHTAQGFYQMFIRLRGRPAQG